MIVDGDVLPKIPRSDPEERTRFKFDPGEKKPHPDLIQNNRNRI